MAANEAWREGCGRRRMFEIMDKIWCCGWCTGWIRKLGMAISLPYYHLSGYRNPVLEYSNTGPNNQSIPNTPSRLDRWIVDNVACKYLQDFENSCFRVAQKLGWFSRLSSVAPSLGRRKWSSFVPIMVITYSADIFRFATLVVQETAKVTASKNMFTSVSGMVQNGCG